MANYDTYLDRVMAERGLENHQLAASAGSSRQAIYKLRKGLTRMLPHWAKRLAPHLGLEWQELVEVKPAPVDAERDNLMATYAAMNAAQRQALIAVANVIAQRGDEPVQIRQPAQQPRVVDCSPELETNIQRQQR